VCVCVCVTVCVTVLLLRCRDEWLQLFFDAGLAVSKVNTIQEAVDDAQLHHRKMLVNVMNHQNSREYTVPAPSNEKVSLLRYAK
jgi:crotonobetainyl-CoA:carnitine CoA-transferase CaiB-like acyl-CoA transferase